MAKIHESVTLSRALRLAEEQMFGTVNPGLCFGCGEEADGCEPDARKYTCEYCDAPRVYGAQEAVFMLS